MEKYWFL